MRGLRCIMLVGLLAALTFASGCGLLINGQTQKVTINTSPQGAEFQIVGAGYQGVTPYVATLKRNQDYQVLFTMEGYEPAQAFITSEMEPLSLVLDVVVFWPALIVDIPLGAAYELDPKNVFVQLREKR